MSGTALERDEIITGLRDHVSELRAAGEVAASGWWVAQRSPRATSTVGPRRTWMRCTSTRARTSRSLRPPSGWPSRGWDADWLNFEVTNADAIQTLGRAVEWETIYDRHGIGIQVASKEAMLAMKFRANRPGRDTRDIRLLLALCDIRTLEEAEELYEEFYPGDLLTQRAERIVTAILDGDPTPVPPSPGPIEI